MAKSNTTSMNDQEQHQQFEWPWMAKSKTNTMNSQKNGQE